MHSFHHVLCPDKHYHFHPKASISSSQSLASEEKWEDRPELSLPCLHPPPAAQPGMRLSKMVRLMVRTVMTMITLLTVESSELIQYLLLFEQYLYQGSVCIAFSKILS